MDRIVIYMMECEMEKFIVLVLIEDCNVLMCLVYYQFLYVFDERNYWWFKLIRVLFVENQFLSIDELDEKLRKECDEFM